MEKGYKYRAATDLNITSLINNQFYASKYNNLNDPTEFFINTEQLDKFLKDFDNIVITYLFGNREYTSPKPIKDLLDKLYSITPNEIHITRENNIETYRDMLGSTNLEPLRNQCEAILKDNINKGIYSLSLDSLNELLWAHYADSHKGFVIEYDLAKLKEQYTIFDVVYENTPPKISEYDLVSDPRSPDRSNTFDNKRFATKSKAWEYEKEIRIITQSEGIKSYSNEAITGIYFGMRMKNDHKKRILNDLSNSSHIRYYQVSTQDNSYELIKKELTVEEIESIIK